MTLTMIPTCNVTQQEKENIHKSAETTRVRIVVKLMHKTKLISLMINIVSMKQIQYTGN